MKTLKNTDNTITIFTANATNGFNQYTNFTLGNGKTSQNTYYFGIPTRYYTPSTQDLNLTWNYQSGNLTSRNDAIKSKTESFTYDNLNRLLTATVTGQSALTVNYATTGNITSKTDVGSYTYHPSKINAVTNVTNTPGNIPTLTQSITYTPFFQPATVSENNYQLNYTYAADYERIKGEFKQNGTTLYTRYYFGNYEKEVTSTTLRHFYYISAGEGLVALVVRENSADTYYYTYTDHLGSILTATNSAGTVVAEQNFDPWGRKRNTTTWTYTGVQSVPTWLYRGYTGHEHMPEFGLINMNGRLYDPILNLMLSADNNVQAPDFTQNYNRYSYAFNNPLRYTDPDGEFLFAAVAIGAAVGAVLNLGIQAALGNVKNFGDGLKAFGLGALSGGLSAGAATSILGGAFSALTSTISSNLPGIPIRIGDFTLTISPAFVYGTSGFGVGLNFTSNLQLGDWNIGASFGFTNFNSSTLTGKVATETRLGAHFGYDDGKRGFAFGTTKFSSPNTSQRLGFFQGRIGDLSFSYENDGTPFQYVGLADGGDSYRTTAAGISYKDFRATMRLGTGYRDYSNNITIGNQSWVNNPEINDYRLGALSLGYKGYEIGWNHDNIRHVFQNRIAHKLIQPQPWIPRTNTKGQLFTIFRTINPYTHW